MVFPLGQMTGHDFFRLLYVKVNINDITMKTMQIKFYPVDNGDTTLISLGDETTILIDCKIREGEENSAGAKIYAVKKDLLETLKRRDGISFVDAFILTHPDEDHCLGFDKNFYTGDPDEYGEKNQDAEEIIIDELWVTPMVFDAATNDDAKAIKKEAERRRKLWEDNKANKNTVGNRIRIIGYNGDERYENLPNHVPGDILTEINGKTLVDFEFFVHAPFKKQLIAATAEKDKNFSSIVMQAAFKQNPSDNEWSTFYLFGGDADHNIWAEILKKSKEHKNEDRLKWDIFLSPHHCSWTYFNNVPYSESEENKTPKETSLSILDYKNDNAIIIASCKVIKNNDDNPPHYQAKAQYLKKVQEQEFLNTAIEPNEIQPEPIVLEVTSSGIERIDEGAKASKLRDVAKGIQLGIIGTTSSGKLSAQKGEFSQHKSHRFYGEQ